MPQGVINPPHTYSPSLPTHLDKGVHSHDGQVRLRLCVVDEVQVHQLLQLQVLCLHAIHNVREEHGHILAHSHPVNREGIMEPQAPRRAGGGGRVCRPQCKLSLFTHAAITFLTESFFRDLSKLRSSSLSS